MLTWFVVCKLLKYSKLQKQAKYMVYVKKCYVNK